jgi:hypothetical protein
MLAVQVERAVARYECYKGTATIAAALLAADRMTFVGILGMASWRFTILLLNLRLLLRAR